MRFDRWAPSYDRSILQQLIFTPIHDAALNACAAACAPPHDLLDIGCGTGRLLEAAARRWHETQFTGIDISEKMIAEALRKHQGDPQFNFKQGDASALPVEDASFDAAFSTMSFHHWVDQTSGIRETARALRPGGLFVLADVDLPLLFLFGPLFNYIDGSKFHAPNDLRQLLEQAGLSVVALRRFWTLSRAQLLVARKRD